MQYPQEYIDSKKESDAVLAQARRAVARGHDIEASAWYQKLDKRLADGEALPGDWQSVKKSSGQRH